MYIPYRANPYLATDAYKQGHEEFMPPGYIGGESYGEPRVGRELERVRWFGIQSIVKQYQRNVLWTKWNEAQADELLPPTGAPMAPGLRQIIRELGHLPITIEAVPEGLVVPAGTMTYRVTSEDARFATAHSWVEAQMLRVWYPTSVCTGSYEMREDAQAAYDKSGADVNNLQFHMHDFGGRGVTCGEQAAIGGAAHLVNFNGTDTTEALPWLKYYYNSKRSGTVLALEHNNVITWIAAYGPEGEDRLIEHLCATVGMRGGFVSMVADTIDQDAFFEKICVKYKDLIDSTFGRTGGKFIPRPDSGKPQTNVVKYGKRLLQAWGSIDPNYGKTPAHIGGIQGDGISRWSHKDCLAELLAARIRADQWAYGSGGKLLNDHNRDDGGWAQKQSLAYFDDGRKLPTQKVPKSDPTKASKAGRLAVTRDDNGNIITILEADLRGRENLMRPIWQNNTLLVDETLDDIMARA